MHARYIITERAAVRFDVGLDDGSADQSVPITILPYAEHQRWAAILRTGIRLRTPQLHL
jgi:hypothetical protein